MAQFEYLLRKIVSMIMKVEFKVNIDYDKYGGKHIAILDNKTIVASGEDFKKVWGEAKKNYPNRKISFMKVPKPELMILIICK